MRNSLRTGRLSSLENRRLKDILILMYKVKNSLAPEHVCKIFFQQDKHYNLRSDFPVPSYNTVKYGRHSIRYLGPHIWGKISQELRSKTSLLEFSREVRTLNVLGLLDGTCGCCHAHLRVVGMRGGACCLADWCIGSVLPYPLFNASNLHLF